MSKVRTMSKLSKVTEILSASNMDEFHKLPVLSHKRVAAASEDVCTDESTKSFVITDKRLMLSVLLNQQNQEEITRIMSSRRYDTPEHSVILDCSGVINYNGTLHYSKSIKAEYVCDLGKIVEHLNNLKNGNDKKYRSKMNSLHYVTLVHTVDCKLQRILALLNLHDISYNFDKFTYRIYQCTDNPDLVIIEQSYKSNFGFKLVMPEKIMILGDYLSINESVATWRF